MPPLEPRAEAIRGAGRFRRPTRGGGEDLIGSPPGREWVRALAGAKGEGTRTPNRGRRIGPSENQASIFLMKRSYFVRV
ncbi:hypothetical protein GCM10022199_07430 [Marihabitans asiaticum]